MDVSLPASLLLFSTLGLAGAASSVEASPTASPTVPTTRSARPPAQLDVKGIVDRAVALRATGPDRYVGLSVIVIKDGKRYQYHYGEAVAGTGTRPKGDTYYPIGSVTKTFTGTLLALFERRDYLDWDDLLSKHLDPSIELSGGRQHIRLRDIALHRSGLPRNPPGGAPPYQTGGYDDDMDALREAVGNCNLTTCQATIGYDEEGLYSNWGFALLADILADARNLQVSGAFKTHLWDPLGMGNTGFKHVLRDQTCLAAGTTCNYDDYGNCSYVAACNDTFHRKAAVGYAISNGELIRGGGTNGTGSNDYIKMGSGILWSTPNDMTKWLAFHMDADGNQSMDLRKIAYAAQRARTDDGTAFFGKYQPTEKGHRYLRKVGTLPDFRTFMGFTDDKEIGIIIMSNQGSFDVTKLGVTLIDRLK